MNINAALFLMLSLSLSLFSQKNIEQHHTIHRLDKTLFEYIQSPTKQIENILLTENKTLLEALTQTLNIKYSSDTDMLSGLTKYFSYPALLDIYKITEDKYDNMSKYEEELNQMLRRASDLMIVNQRTYFYTHVSGFKENIISIENIISLSLDKYLGKNFKYYAGYFDKEEQSQMIPEMIIRDYTIGWLMSNCLINSNLQNGNLLANMIYQGKLYYILTQLLPDYSIHNLLGCSIQDMEWYKEHEKYLWKEITKNNYLYSNDRTIINTWMLSKNTSYFTITDVPSKVGNWIGYQIVKKYVMNTSCNISELLKTDDNTIFKKSKYMP